MEFDDVELTRLLADNRPLVRRKALRHLLGSKPDVHSDSLISIVLRYRCDSDHRTRCLVSEILIRNNRVELLEVWTELLGDESSEVVNNAQAGLVELGDVAIPRLVDEIVLKTTTGRLRATEILGRIGLVAVPALLQLSESTDKEIAFRGRHGLTLIDLSRIPLEDLRKSLLTHSDPATQGYILQHLVDRADEEPLNVWLERVIHPLALMRQMTASALRIFGHQEQVVNGLLELLRDEEIVVSVAALDSLARLQSSETAPDIAKLFHREPTVRGRVIEVLCDLNSEQTVVDCGAEAVDYVVGLIERHEGCESWSEQQKLSSALKMLGTLIEHGLLTIDDRLLNLLVRNVDEYRAGEILVCIGERAVPLLLAALTERPESLSTVAYYLGMIGDKRACVPLRHAVPHCSEGELSNVLFALGQLGDLQALPAILSHRDHADWKVREAVVEALAELGESASLEAMAAGLTDGKREVRRAAVIALGKIQGEEALNRLIDWLHTTQEVGLREEAIIAVGQFGSAGKAAVPTLVGLLDDPSYSICEYISEAWDKRGGDGHFWVRFYAARSLGMVGDPAAAQALVAACEKNQSDWWVREEIATALGELKCNVARDGLNLLLTDPEEEVRAAATKALARWSP